MVKLVPILHSSAVDLGSHPSRVNQRGGIDGQALAAVTDFDRAPYRDVAPLPPWE